MIICGTAIAKMEENTVSIHIVKLICYFLLISGFFLQQGMVIKRIEASISIHKKKNCQYSFCYVAQDGRLYLTKNGSLP